MRRVLVYGTDEAQHVQDFLGHHQSVLRLSASAHANISGIADTVAEEIAFGLETLGLSRQHMQERVAEVAAQLEIEHLLLQHPLKLSGGQTQRVAIACLAALGNAPLLLEHPLQGLDARGRQLVLNFIKHHPHEVLWTSPISPGCDETAVATQVVGTPETAVSPISCHIDWELGGASTRNMPALETHQLGIYVPESRRIKKTRQLLHRVSLTVRTGEFLVITGQNGTGKTTLLRTLAGLLPADAAVTVDGHDTRNLKPPQRVQSISLAAQHPRYQVLTTSVHAEVQAGRARSAYALCNQLIEAVGLGNYLATNPYDLTLSQQQMLAIACACASNPKVLLLDEPSASLTPADRQRLMILLRRYATAGGAVILTSHDETFTAAFEATTLKLSPETS